MKFWFSWAGIATIILGCGSSIFLSPAENVKQGQYLIMRKKATIYGQIQNQKRNVHIVIQKKGALSKGEHILGDSAGIFTIQIDSGTYRFFNDNVSTETSGRTSGKKSASMMALFPSDCYNLHHEFTVSNKTLVYIGSLFLTDENIDISFEKQYVDSLMKIKYSNFKVDRTTEIYPERLPIDSVFCIQRNSLPSGVRPTIK
jgi:hypothetical protein